MAADEFSNEDFFADDADEVREYKEEDLSQLTKLASRQLEIEQHIKELEEQLAKAKRDLYQVSAEDIPGLMDEIGMQEFLLKSGERIKVRRVVKASIPQKHKAEALRWLRDNNAGSLIKNEVTAAFGKGEDQNAFKLFAALQKRGLNVKQKEGVHGQTLAAYVREQMEKGIALPNEILGVFEYMETKVTKA